MQEPVKVPKRGCWALRLKCLEAFSAVASPGIVSKAKKVKQLASSKFGLRHIPEQSASVMHSGGNMATLLVDLSPPIDVVSGSAAC